MLQYFLVVRAPGGLTSGNKVKLNAVLHGSSCQRRKCMYADCNTYAQNNGGVYHVFRTNEKGKKLKQKHQMIT